MNSDDEPATSGKTSNGLEIKRSTETPAQFLIRTKSVLIPEEISRETDYAISRTLGVRGKAVVYEALQTSVSRSGALNMMHPETAGDEGCELA